MSTQKSKARQELDKDRKFIFWLFGKNCLMCGKPTNTIHEIIPISGGRTSLHWTNRVPLCVIHHSWAHESTKVSIPILQEKRLEYLKRKGEVDLEEKRLELFDTVSELENEEALVHS